MTTLPIIMKIAIFAGITASATGIWIAMINFFKSVGRNSKAKPQPDKPISNWVYFKGNTNSLYYAYNPVDLILISVVLGSMSSVSHMDGENINLHHAVSAYVRKKSFYKQIRPEEFVSVFNQVSDKFNFSL